jgi:hypothetical protein
MSASETAVPISSPIGSLAKAITMAFADMAQVKLSHVYIYRFPFCSVGKRLKTDSAEVEFIIQRRPGVTEDMVEMESHLQVSDAILLKYTFTLVTDIFAATVSAFIVDIDSKVHNPAVFLGRANDDEAVVRSRTRRCSYHLPIDSVVMANLSIRHFAHKDGRSVFAAFSQVYGIYAVKADLDIGLYNATRVRIVGRLCLISFNICQGDVQMIEADAPSVFGDETLSDEIFTVSVELKSPRRRAITTTTGKYDTCND